MARPRKLVPDLYWLQSEGCYCITIAGRRYRLGADREAADRARLKLAHEHAGAAQAARESPSPHPVDNTPGGPRRSVGDVLVMYAESLRPNVGVRYAARVLQMVELVSERHGRMVANDFSALHVEEVRRRLCEEDYARSTANAIVGALQTAWRWALSRVLLAGDHARSVLDLRPLAKGEGGREPSPRLPANDADVDATLPHLPPVPRAAVELLRLVGARPGELLGMRRCDLSTTAGEFVEPLAGLRVAAQKVGRVLVWLFVPQTHKGTRKEKPRVIAFGRAAQKVLRPLLVDLHGEDAVFSPDRSEAQRSADRRKRRKSKVYESQEQYRQARQPDEPARPPGETYEPCALAKAVRRACLAAGVSPWSPYQLRHRFAVDLADVSDDATAAVGLGHAEGSTATARYTRAQVRRVVELAAERG